MDTLPTDWSALCALVLLLGMRHGFDADHLAAIDGLTGIASRHHRRFARACGALFSLGHGAGVVGVIALSYLTARWLAQGGAVRARNA